MDRYLDYARALPRLPDLIHSHYADAGHVASRLSALLGIPFVHTGHSLGRCKLARMLEAGGKLPGLERSFHFGRRIEAEEETLRYASRVLASTRQEIRGQYGLYSHFSPRRAVVVPPGTDTSRFAPPGRRGADPGVAGKVDRFLAHARRPVVLCIGRPVPSKNLLGLVRAFADPELRARANLVLLAGSHEDIADLDAEGRATWEELLRTLDRLDLFGSVAFPRNHLPAEVPEFYRLAVARRGIYRQPVHQRRFRPHADRSGGLRTAGGHHRQRRPPRHRGQLPQRARGGTRRRPGPGRRAEGGPGRTRRAGPPGAATACGACATSTPGTPMCDAT